MINRHLLKTLCWAGSRAQGLLENISIRGMTCMKIFPGIGMSQASKLLKTIVSVLLDHNFQHQFQHIYATISQTNKALHTFCPNILSDTQCLSRNFLPFVLVVPFRKEKITSHSVLGISPWPTARSFQIENGKFCKSLSSLIFVAASNNTSNSEPQQMPYTGIFICKMS